MVSIEPWSEFAESLATLHQPHTLQNLLSVLLMPSWTSMTAMFKPLLHTLTLKGRFPDYSDLEPEDTDLFFISFYFLITFKHNPLFHFLFFNLILLLQKNKGLGT
jgi:hypothetical protein